MQKKASFLVAVLDHIRSRLDPREHGLAAAFTRQFWSRVVPEDLENRNAEDAAGMTIACFRHFQRRTWDAVDIDVENPQYERDGWSSIHTIVQIAHPNMPFITDSVLMELSRHGLITHHLQNMVFAAVRDAEGNLLHIDPQASEARAEVMIYAEIDRLEEDRLAPLAAQLDSILKDVRAAVGDFPAMKARIHAIAAALKTAPPPLSAEEVEESVAFLEWLEQGSFTFLGYREFDFSGGTIRQVPDSALGILRNREPSTERLLAEQPDETRAFLLERTLLAFSKSGTRSQVHRPAYPDYIAVKRFNAAGEVDRRAGLSRSVYVARLYRTPGHDSAVAQAKSRTSAGVPGSIRDGFDGKILTHVLASYPRDELFQSSEDELFATAMAITQIHERRRTRVFLRRDRYGSVLHVSRLHAARAVQHAAAHAHSAAADGEARRRRCAVRRVFLRIDSGAAAIHDARAAAAPRGPVDIEELQRSIVALARDWAQDVRQALVQECGESEDGVSSRRISTLSRGLSREFAARRGGRHRDMEQLERAAQPDDAALPRPEDPDRHVFPAGVPPR